MRRARTLAELGETLDAMGDANAARHAWTDALRIFETLSHPDAALICERLTRVLLAPPGHYPYQGKGRSPLSPSKVSLLGLAIPRGTNPAA